MTLGRRTPLKRTGGLKRTSFRRTTRAEVISERVTTQVRLRSGGLCEARISPDCRHYGVHRHHRKLRRSGDHRAVNLLYVCIPDHVWIHANPVLAECGGLLLPSWVDPQEYLDESAYLLACLRNGNPNTPTWRAGTRWETEALSLIARVYPAAVEGRSSPIRGGLRTPGGEWPSDDRTIRPPQEQGEA